jgi:uncharacterized repeat protein (TIGR01451 family)
MDMKRIRETGPGSEIKRLSAALFLAVAFLFTATAGPRAGELIQGGGFETGSFVSPWVDGAARSNGQIRNNFADHVVALDLPYSGNWSALIGFKYTAQRSDRYGFIYHDVTIPTNISRAVLNFRFRQQGFDGLQYDPFIAAVRRTNGALREEVVEFAFGEWNNQFKDSGWIQDNGDGTPGYDLTSYAGQTIRIDFRQYNSYDDLYETWAFVDDVSLKYYKFVDLAVDGNGDDLFGNPGTGAGGSSYSSGEAGETVTYLLEIENEGLDADSYTLSAAPPAGWTAVINYGGTDHAFPWTTPAVSPGTRITAEVRLTIPAGASLGGYSTILNAVSSSFGNRYDSVRLYTSVIPADFLVDLTIDSNGLGVIDPGGNGGVSFIETPPNTTVDFTVDLYNEGALSDVFRIRWAVPAPLAAVVIDGGTTHSGQFLTGPIASGSSGTFTLRVTMPAQLAGGDYSTFLYAVSQGDTLKKDGVRAVTRILAPKLDMLISGSGNNIYDLTGSGLGGASTVTGTRGAMVTFPVTFQNEGAVRDSFTVSWTSPGNGWSAVIRDSGGVTHAFPWTTPGSAPFTSREYVLIITIPGNAAYDTYVSILNAVSRVNGAISESVTAAVSVSSSNETDLVIDGDGNNMYGALGTGLGASSVHTSSPGDTVSFSVFLENENGENLFDIQWNSPAGWTVLFNGLPSPLTGMTSGTYLMQVVVPAGSAGGTFDIILDAFKTNKHYAVDSGLNRVIVIPGYRVDALIDGNGDGIYGTPGMGGGGSSLQSTISGRTVSFTVELQNEGSLNENYNASWNSFAGWAATLDAGASPFTTGNVIPGGSRLYLFRVTIPSTASPGDYDYVINVVSTVDPGNVESVIARIRINPPPSVDLTIDGNGAFDIAVAGSGLGGSAMVFGAPGTLVTATLGVVNRGGFPDSIRISWADPAGWPAGSIVLNDGTSDHSSPFVTPVINPAASATYTMQVSIPAASAPRSRLIIDGLTLSGNFEDSVLLEIITSAFVTGRVFEDADHDGLYTAGETGLGGVTITLTDPSTPLTFVTIADGSYIFEVPGGILRDVIELTPTGMISISPDTVSAGTPLAGDTVTADFADVRLSFIAPVMSANGPAGGSVYIAHTITAGTAGQSAVAAALPAGWLDVWYRDANGDGVMDAGDTKLTAADLDLDPAVPGRDIVPVIVQIFIPAAAPAGTTGSCVLTLEQTLSGTVIVTTSEVTDLVAVLASASGLLDLVKAVDRVQARPGDVITYTITFTNPGIEDVREIEIYDPISPAVDLVADAYGPGNDIAWTRGGTTVYLTADQADADEALYDPGSNTLRVILSRQATFVLGSGEMGIIEYRVRIR